MVVTIIFFLIWRILDIFTAYIAHIFDTYHEHFAYRYQLYHHNPYIPPFLINFANYDGANYMHIAHSGYGMYEQAYFPFFPFLVHIFAPVFGYGYFLAGFLISNIGFFFGLYFFKKYLEAIGKKRNDVYWALTFLLIFPTSFFFGAVYTEGLFFFFVGGALYYSQKRYYWKVFIFCFLAALTRFMGAFLVIPLIATLLVEHYHVHLTQKTFVAKATYLLQFISTHIKLLFVVASPLLGLCVYMLYLFLTVQNPFYFYNAVSAFHTQRTTSHIILLPQVYYRYIHIFLQAPHNFVYFVALVEFFICNLFIVVLFYDLWRLWKKETHSMRGSLIGLNLFSFVNLILPTLTGTMTSLPRYALFSLSFFVRLGSISNIGVKIALFTLFVLFHLLLLVLFIQGYFIS